MVNRFYPWLCLLAALLLAGCRTAPYTPAAVTITELPTWPTTEVSLTATELSPEKTNAPNTPTNNPTVQPPTVTALPATPTQPPASATPVAVGEQTVNIFLIALDDNGQAGKLVGCGDSAVAVKVQIPKTLGVLKAALEALLAVKTQYYGESGLYNSLYQSDLRLISVGIVNGKATIRLAGTLRLGGECDNPRVEAQIMETALQFTTVKTVEVFLNDRPLKDALSLK